MNSGKRLSRRSTDPAKPYDHRFIEDAPIVLLSRGVRPLLAPMNKERRNRLEEFRIDAPDSSLPFSHRLARENSWQIHYAERVIIEYKRFLYLVVTQAGELTPSDQVDQAWHLHLTYTHSYWCDLCQGILGCEVHHNPTRGGDEEQSRFKEQYEHTLSLYRQVFGFDPPADIWPATDKRFKNVDKFERVNKADTWVVTKPKYSHVRALLFLVPLGFLVACSESLSEGDAWFWAKTAIGIIGVLYLLKKMNDWLGGGSKGGSGCGAGCGGCGGCGC